MAALACVYACALQPQTPVASEPQPFTAVWDGQVDEAALWTQWLSEDLESDGSALINLIPADATEFCSTWRTLDHRGREQVWITLISAIAEHESGFDPHASFNEPPPLAERSIGLMQLSLSDAAEFHCDFTSESQIEDVHRNLQCAVRILAELVPLDGVVGGGWRNDRIGGAAYWSVLNVRGHADAHAFIVGQTRALPACRRWPKRPSEARPEG